jgi:hypothetical protein
MFIDIILSSGESLQYGILRILSEMLRLLDVSINVKLEANEESEMHRDVN